MFATFLSTIIFLSAAASDHAAEPGTWAKFLNFYETYLNYPGFELWKFINLGIFVALMVYLVKTPLSETFKAKRDAIRAELIKAEEEKQSALKQLTSAEAKIAQLEAEKAAILKRTSEEAEAEKKRIAEQADIDVRKLSEQTSGEIARLQKQVMFQLRRFSAEESIRLAEEKLRAQIDPAKDAHLVKSSIASIGGLN